MPQIALFEPEIPHNTGAVARTCALTGTPLHLIKPLGFSLEDRYLKRCGLDYWPLVDLHIHESFSAFERSLSDGIQMYFATTKASRSYAEIRYAPGDVIVFGRETSGLPEELLRDRFDHAIRIPMIPEIKRSLNLSNSCAIILYEALRQLEFPFLKR